MDCLKCVHAGMCDGLFSCEVNRAGLADNGICDSYEEKKDAKPTAKADTGKPRISLVPPAIITAIAQIREYGVEKYKDPDNWRKVEIGRFHDAFLRHAVGCMGDLNAVDEESGLPHLHHAACNLAFILEMIEGKDGRI